MAAFAAAVNKHATGANILGGKPEFMSELYFDTGSH